MPPQQQNSTAIALANLGALGGLAGATGSLRTPADQFLALMSSNSARDRLIDRFDLQEVYDAKLRDDARRELGNNTRMFIGKKDGLITVEVDDTSPKRAADIANAYVEELRRMLGVLAVTEAQQRRVFFETQMKATRDALSTAQRALQDSGINASALRAEPRAAADSYARLRAEATATEVRVQTLRRTLAESSTEVQQALATLAAVRSQIARLEQGAEATSGADYIGKYREFKYQEALFELIARQYELARVDESREGALIQVVDFATPPERKSRPRRALLTLWAWLGSLTLLVLWTVAADTLRHKPFLAVRRTDQSAGRPS
jgi:uncharacterized protein involved in exopolysaccharide biosynthesis